MQRHKSMVLIALVIGALLLSLATPVLSSGATAEVALADSTEQSLELPLGSLGDFGFSNWQWLPRWGPPACPSADKWAVVIGISDYEDYEGMDRDLWNPDKNAREMTRALVTKYGFPRRNIIQLCNEEATAAAILAAINWLEEQEGPDSTVVFFFSGHGGQLPDLWGLDNDSEDDFLDEGIISHEWSGFADGVLGEMFSEFETTKFALIFDCCNSGGMLDDVDGLKAEGRVIVSACGADQLAYDYRFLRNTLFGYFFIDRGILHRWAETDWPPDGVSMEEAFEFAHDWVLFFEPDSEPQIYDGFAGELIL